MQLFANFLCIAVLATLSLAFEDNELKRSVILHILLNELKFNFDFSLDQI